jgi:hypothetical protein
MSSRFVVAGLLFALLGISKLDTNACPAEPEFVSPAGLVT